MNVCSLLIGVVVIVIKIRADDRWLVIKKNTLVHGTRTGTREF